MKMSFLNGHVKKFSKMLCFLLVCLLCKQIVAQEEPDEQIHQQYTHDDNQQPYYENDDEFDNEDDEALEESSTGKSKKTPFLWRVWWDELKQNDHITLIKALLICIIVFTLCQIILLIWILFNRHKLKIRETETQNMIEIFESQLFEFLMAEKEVEIREAYRRIARTATTKPQRELLISQIRELSKSMSMGIGGSEKVRYKLRYLYTSLLHLEKDSIKKLSNSKWHINIKGFRELAFMGITDANPNIHKFLKSKNNTLRTEAQLALVRLNEKDPFTFLDHLVHPFTLWEQLGVYELLSTHNLPVPQFSRWTNSQNKTVTLFALRMIQVFKQREAFEQIVECLGHYDDEIRRTAIHICGELQMRESLPYLRSLYKGEVFENCYEIIKAMGKMPDESMLSFLKLVLDKEDDVLLQIEAAQAIQRMGEVGVSALVKLMKSEYKNYQIIIRHVLDKRIH
jgi:HEAT repeat protein